MIIKDHLNNEYKSTQEMLDHYKVEYGTYWNRLKKGWTLEEALLGRDICMCIDHLGNKYKSISEICRQYGVAMSVYQRRIKSGLSVEEALTKKPDIHRPLR